MGSTAQKTSAGDSWMARYWRPLTGITYITINVCDFIIFPAANGIFYYITQQPVIPWTPLTLQSGSMFHLAFGAILGVTAWGRTQEKINSPKSTTND